MSQDKPFTSVADGSCSERLSEQYSETTILEGTEDDLL